MANITDVARAAGVAKSTVSRVLNGKEYVSGETRSKVLEAIQRLSFHRDSAAQGLRTKKTMLLAMVVPVLDHDYFLNVISGAGNATRARGYNIVICDTEISLENEREVINLFLRRIVDGLIFVHPETRDAELIQHALKGVRFVVVGRPVIGNVSIPAVIADNEKGAYDAVTHLIKDHGRRRIAYIHGPPNNTDEALRFSGYYRALAEAGLPFTPDLTGHAGGSPDWAAIAVEGMIDAGKQPDAVFCFADMLAWGVCRKLRQRGIRVPEDIAVIGVDDTKVGRWMHPSLATVMIPTHQMGSMAANKLLDRLEDKEDEPAINMVPVRFLPRGSCGCPEREA